MFGLHAPELIIILLIALIFFGPSKLESFAKSLGKSVSMFKKGVKEGEEEAKKTPEPSKSSEENTK